MKQCPNCRNSVPDEAVFCPVCGTSINAFHSFPEPYPPQNPTSPPPVYIPPAVKENPLDHTKLFSKADIQENKLLCLVVYLFDLLGIIIALLAAKDSPYVKFHTRISMKYSILEAILGIVSLLLCWTLIVPIVCAVAMIVLYVLKFVSFTQVCGGKAIDPAIISKIQFLN